MSIEIGLTYRQDLPLAPGIRGDPSSPVQTDSSESIENIGQPSYSALVTMIEGRTYSLKPMSLQNRPLEPLEPEPYATTALEWAEYIIKRDRARAYAAENDLRGTF